jgi:hypothetical protein
MPPQFSRLILLAAVLLGSYVCLRAFLRPHSFGEFGHYRGAALAELAQRPLSFAGAKACSECHDELFPVLAKGPHKTISCESCHGPQKLHADNPDTKPGSTRTGLCLRCHSMEPARPATQRQIDPRQHYPDSSCRECHLPHLPTEAPQ